MPKLPPPSPFLSSALQASPHLNQLTKAIALKSHKKRFIFIIVSISLILFYYWTPSQGGVREQIEGVELNSKECKFLTWRKKCQSTVAEEDLSPVDYEIKAGQLFYPGTLELEGDFTGEQEIPAQAHPIHLLMEQAQKNWTEKVNKQSKTLHEAVAEYEKRYGMRPPRGQ